jgi:hypothetical protein
LYKSAETGLLLHEDDQWNSVKESVMSQSEPEEPTWDLLDRVRHSRAMLPVFDTPSGQAEAVPW